MEKKLMKIKSINLNVAEGKRFEIMVIKII